jgi:hypothetical protein
VAQQHSVIELVRRLLDDVPEPSEARLSRHEWTPLRGSTFQRLFRGSASERAARRVADEAKSSYDEVERQLDAEQAADRSGAHKRLASAKGPAESNAFTVRYTDDIARRWSNRLATAIQARAVAERLRQVPIERAVEFGATRDGIEWLRSARARNLREASVLVMVAPAQLEYTWYSKITGLIGPHCGPQRADFAQMEESLGCTTALSGIVDPIATAESCERRDLASALPTAEEILDRWERAADKEARLTEVRGECEREECIRMAELHVAKLRWRSAVIGRVRAATRAMIADAARRVEDASTADAPA